MGLFKKAKGASRGLYTPPSGLVSCPRAITRSVPFVFDANGQPAASGKITLLKQSSQHVSLVKSAEVGEAALRAADLAGLQTDVIVLLDTSYSMDHFYDDPSKPIVQLLIRTLGWALNVDADGVIPVIRYGGGVLDPVNITIDNYQDAGALLRPNYGSTPMTEALQKALAMAARGDKMTIIFNLTDGNPNNATTMSNEVINSSTTPVMLKNLALQEVSYLEELDDMPSLWQIRTGADGDPVKDAKDMLFLDENTETADDKRPRRFIDNVDSQEVDPYKDSEEVFAAKMTEEISTLLEVWGRTGILTGVPGVERTIFPPN